MSDKAAPAASGVTGVRVAQRANNLETITAAAREVFVERGYHGASIRDIAARAGMSLSALYYWHSSKQDLLAALLAESRRDYLATCRAAITAAPAGDPAAQLGALVGATVRYRVRRRAESALTAAEWKHLEGPHLTQLDQDRAEATRMWADIVGAGVRSGAFRCPYPDDARRAVEASCNAIAEWYDPSGPVGVDDLENRYVDIAMRIVDYRPA
jgi:AcrR family transcriptional regulator